LFLSYQRPSHVPSEHIALNHLQNILSHCVYSGILNVCHLRRSCTLPLDVISDCICPFYFLISYVVDPMLCEGITILQLLPLFRNPNYFKFLRKCYKVKCFLVTAVPCLPIFGFFGDITIVRWAL